MFTQSFPPADDLLKRIMTVDYRKHLNQITTVFLTLVAVSHVLLQFLYNKVEQWYSNGGKELLLNYAHRAVLFINNRTGLFDKLYAATVYVYNLIELVAHKISDVTDVEVAQ